MNEWVYFEILSEGGGWVGLPKSSGQYFFFLFNFLKNFFFLSIFQINFFSQIKFYFSFVSFFTCIKIKFYFSFVSFFTCIVIIFKILNLKVSKNFNFNFEIAYQKFRLIIYYYFFFNEIWY